MTERTPAYTLTILPVEIKVGDTLVTILEATKLKLPWDEWICSCQIKIEDIQSKVFSVTYKDSKELALKLDLEVTKFKYLLFLYGKEKLIEMGLAIPSK
jgi:hypothetical protein